MVGLEIVNLAEFRAQLAELGKGLAERALVVAVKAGGLLIQNAAKEHAPYKTGELRRSIHMEVAESDDAHVVLDIGTDVPYAPRIEFGFADTDKLGREYHQEARPYLRPAFDENKDAAIAEINAALVRMIESQL